MFSQVSGFFAVPSLDYSLATSASASRRETVPEHSLASSETSFPRFTDPGLLCPLRDPAGRGLRQQGDDGSPHLRERP